MKRFSIAIALFFCGPSLPANHPPTVDPEKTDTYFSVGSIDDKPEGKKSEFKFSEKDGTTVQIRKEDDFPRKAKAGQRLAIFLDNIKSTDNLSLELVTRIVGQVEYSSIPVMELRYNGNIFYRMSQSRGRRLKLFIPASWHEKGSNVLEIRNLGSHPIEFVCLVIKKYSPPNPKGDKPSNDDIPHRISNFGSRTAKIAEANTILREKAACFLPYELIKYLNESGQIFSLKEISRQKDFFDPFTRKPILAYYALQAASPLFEGNPQKTLCDLFPVANGENINDTVWTAVTNTPFAITCAVATTPDDKGKYMELLLPVPWAGETELDIINGILPEGKRSNTQWLSSKSIKKEKISIDDGLFKRKLNFNDFCILRLAKTGEKPPKAIQFPKSYAKGQIKFDGTAFSTSAKRPAPRAIRYPLLEIKPGYQPKNPSRNYQTEITPATKGDIGKIKAVAPWDSNSVKIEISYPEGKPFDEEWVAVNFKPLPEKFDYFSFWVYPRCSNRKTKKVTLLTYFQDESANSRERKFKFQAVHLKTGVWRRVLLPARNCLFKNNFRIVGNPKLPEYKKGGKVSFELNGFCTVGTEHPQYGESGLKSIRCLSGKENISLPATAETPEKTIKAQVEKLVLTGFPEKYFEYRRVFPEPVKFHKITALSKIKGIDLIWHQDAQLLEIKGKFPDKEYRISKKLTDLLTAKEKKYINAGKIAPIGIKLVYER